jgi:hypothetical protein
MEHYHYPTASLVQDYLRVAFGLAVTAGPLAALDLAQGMAWLLSGLAVVFAWFGVRTALRQLSWVELSAAEIALCGPIRRRLPWQEVRRLRLAYYAPRRAQQEGWLQLTLRGRSGPAIRVDSTLEGFDDVLRRATGAAVRNDVPLDAATQANLAALGFAPAAQRSAAAPALRPAPDGEPPLGCPRGPDAGP